MPFIKATTIARWESRLRPFMVRLPARLAIGIYSTGRLDFLARLAKDIPKNPYQPPATLHQKLWGLDFRSPIMNAAGIFKNGDCYEVSAAQGAGAFLGGTGTWNPRPGNKKLGIRLPFAPYPLSHAASNWLGLPNKGDRASIERIKTMQRTPGMPIGWSIMGSPDFKGEEKLKHLVDGLNLYEQAKVDFIEINESCPNTHEAKPQENDLANRLEYIKKHFLDKRQRHLPVVVKFSNDTDPQQIPDLIDLLVQLNFDGITLGNTSVKYADHRNQINPKERPLYDYFTKNFGGGISGKPLNKASLELCTLAVKHLKKHPPKHEFHVIRAGGIETWHDIEQSQKAGIALNQWYTGYFENFARHGHNIYRELLKSAK